MYAEQDSISNHIGLHKKSQVDSGQSYRCGIVSVEIGAQLSSIQLLGSR